jgi:hypothetical protein
VHVASDGGDFEWNSLAEGGLDLFNSHFFTSFARRFTVKIQLAHRCFRPFDHAEPIKRRGDLADSEPKT